MLEIQNKQRNEAEQQNKETLNRKKLEEREKGFNTYLQGANQDRVPQNQQQSKVQQSNQRGVRRQWRDPSRSNERDLSRSPITAFENNSELKNQNVYHNPFDLTAQASQCEKTNPQALMNAFKKQYKKDNLSPDEIFDSHKDQIQNKNITNSNRKKWQGSKIQQVENDIVDYQQTEIVDLIEKNQQKKQKSNQKNKFKSSQRLAGSDDEDNYSDDFEIQIDSNINKDRRQKELNLQIIQENVNESKDQDTSFIPDVAIQNQDNSAGDKNNQDQSCAHIEMFLKTATDKEMDLIRESLSNFQEFSNFQVSGNNIKSQVPANSKDQPDKKSKKVIAIEEDNIEEEFDEQIPEDNGTSEDEEYKPEKKQKKEQKIVGKKNRPVSAVYDIEQFKAKNNYSSNDIINSQKMAYNGIQSQSSLPIQNTLLSNNYQQSLTTKDSQQKLQKVDSKQQLNVLKQFPQIKSQLSLKNDNEKLKFELENNKKQQLLPNKQIESSSIATNPFKRPFSYANPQIKNQKHNPQRQNNKFISNDYNSSSQLVQNQKLDDKLPIYGSQKIESLGLHSKNNLSKIIDVSYGIQSTHSNVSNKVQELNQIMSVISRLDDTQRQGLLNILKDKIEPKIDTDTDFISNFRQSNILKGAESQRNIDFGKEVLQNELDQINAHIATVQQKSAKNQLKMPNKFGLHEPINPFTESVQEDIKTQPIKYQGPQIQRGGSQIGNNQNQIKIPLQKNPSSNFDKKNQRKSIEKKSDFDKKSQSRNRLNNANKRQSLDEQNSLPFVTQKKANDNELKQVPIWLQSDLNVPSTQKILKQKEIGIQYQSTNQNQKPYPSFNDPLKKDVSTNADKSNLNKRQIEQRKKLEEEQKNSIPLNSKQNNQMQQEKVKQTTLDVKNAVNSVNNLVSLKQQSNKDQKLEDIKKIEDSFDCLDMFKFTNKGRIQFQEKFETQDQEQNKKETIQNADNEFKLYQNQDLAQISNQQEIQDSNFGSNSKVAIRSSRKAPKIIKSNVIPNEFSLPSPCQKKQPFSINQNIPEYSQYSNISQQFNPSTSEQIIKALDSKKNTDQIQNTPNFDKKQIEEKDFLNKFYTEINFDSQITNKEQVQLKQKVQKNDDSLIDEFEKELNEFDKQLQKNTKTQMISSKKSIGLEQNINNKQVLKVIGNTQSREQIFKNKLQIFRESFIIPVLPQGSILEFNILQTWGDINYVGLTGIEVFNEDGEQIMFDGNKDISANPADINLLMGYGSDPRTVDKLVDGHYFTNDDFHAWLTPFTQGEDHTITLKLPYTQRISMIRIWNYNKSRIHSYRGARLITCQLDQQIIFQGEIQKAPGNTTNLDQSCEIILFTQDEQIYKKIDQNDWVQNIQLQKDEDQNEDNSWDHLEQERPMTATKKFDNDEIQEMQRALQNPDNYIRPTSLFDERPQTKAIKRQTKQLDTNFETENKELDDFKPKQIIKGKQQLNKPNKTSGVKGRLIELNIKESWGDMFYVGLNGLEIRDINDNIIDLDIKNLDAKPKDMNSIPGHGQDHRTLDKLINGINNTISDINMWLIPFNLGEDHTIKIDLGRNVQIASIKFYNYNKSQEDSLRGVKLIVIKIDGKLQTPSKGITLRKAPGFILSSNPQMCSDIGQIIYLPYNLGWKPNLIMPLQKIQQLQKSDLNLLQEYEPISIPIGFSYRINLYSTYGDSYYIGLNGLELYDQLGQLIKIDSQKHVFANPSGISSIKGMENDVRTIDKLFNSTNITFDDRNMWLAPFKFTRSHAAANSQKQDQEKREPNFIMITFDQPQSVSCFKIYNYSKTSKRGVNEFEILVDDKPVFRGFAKKAPDSQEEWMKSNNKDFSTSVIFSRDAKIIDQFKNQINFDPVKHQEVLMFNEKVQINQSIKSRPNENFVFNEHERPQTKYGGK